MADVITMLNTIRKYASADYKATVDVATQNNFLQVGSQILNYENISNEFLSALINRIGFTMVHNKVFKNPLSVLKKGNVPMGSDIQEIYTNPAKGGTYDGTSNDLLSVFKSDVKVAYYRINRKARFEKSISEVDFQNAFTSLQNMQTFITSIVNSIYNGDEIEQWQLTKEIIADAYINNKIRTININDDTGLTWTQINAMDNPGKFISEWLILQLQTYSELFALPSSQYNKFAEIKGGGTTPVVTWTPLENQTTILPANIKAGIKVKVLAGAFNMSEIEIKQRLLTLDSFIGQPILGLLCDENCFQIYENRLIMKPFNNPATLIDTYFLHHWQTFGFSLLANCIAFTYTPDSVLLVDGSLGTSADSKITGLTASTAYNVSINGATAVSKTTNSSGEITGLDNTKTYFVSSAS